MVHRPLLHMGGDEMSHSALPYIRSLRYAYLSLTLSLSVMMMMMMMMMMMCVFAHTYYRVFTDLYPVGHWVNQTGVIVVRYLPAISPTEATSRDDMMRLVRGDDDADGDGDDDDVLFDLNKFGR